MRAVGKQVMQPLSKPEERPSLVTTTNLNFRQRVGWVTAMLTDRRLQGDGSEVMYVADGLTAAHRDGQLCSEAV
jgi:hypothetical protein